MESNLKLATIDLVIILLFIVGLISLGVWVSYRRKASQDLFLGGRSIGWGNVGFSIWAANMGPWNLLGMCGIAYATGIVTAAFDWIVWICLLLLAMLFAPYYLHSKVTTMPQFIKERFGLASYNYLSWYALLGTMIVWLGGTMYSGAVFLSQVLHWPFWLSLLVISAVALSFTIKGGFLAITITNTFQAILIIAVSVILNLVLLHHVGGVRALINGVPEVYWQLFRPAHDPDFPAYALVLGVLTGGIWFWCTDQTIVQRVLGAKDLHNGQMGAWFAALLKILPPVLFMLPGIMLYALRPNLADPDEAYLTIVATYLPTGLVGLIIAIVLAALLSTINAALNSFSTILSLDVYVRYFRPQATESEKRTIGQVSTVAGAVLVLFVCLWMRTLSKDLFNLVQSLVSFFSPPMTAVFLLGVLWKRATGKAAFWGMVVGTIVSFAIGACYFGDIPYKGFWPHYLLLAFYLAVGIALFMVILSLLTKNSNEEQDLPTLREAYATLGSKSKQIWVAWAALAALMLAIYLSFS